MTTPDVFWISILPELVLAVGAAAALLVEVQWKPSVRALGTLAGLALTIAAAISVVQWFRATDALVADSPLELVGFSGMIVMDGLAVFARIALLVVAGAGLLAGWRYLEGTGRRAAEAIALLLLAAAGFSLMVASNNLVMMFLGLEIGSISLYVLAGFTRENPHSDEAAIKYFLLGSFASAIFIYGVALLYAGTGSFEVLEMRQFLSGVLLAGPGVILIGLALVVVGLAFKISAAPFHSWAPDVYQGAPAGVVGYMAALAKVAGFGALIRVLLTGVGELDASWLPLVAGLSAVSMVLGSVVALVQSDVRRMLAYSGVAHAGFILTGIVGEDSTSTLFYVAVYALQLLGAFAVVASVSGSSSASSTLEEYRGLGARSPLLAGAFTVLLLGMAGLPLTSGFVAKFGVFADAWGNGYEWLVIVAVLASVVAFAFYLRIIVAMYMEEREGEGLAVSGAVRWVLGAAVLATIGWGIFPGSLLDLAADAFQL